MIPLIAVHHDQLADLCRRYGVRRLDVFGSAVREDFDPDASDLDFVVDFQDLTVRDAADRYLGLFVDLEDLFGRKIDLVMDRAVRNPYFRQTVDQTRVPVYAA